MKFLLGYFTCFFMFLWSYLVFGNMNRKNCVIVKSFRPKTGRKKTTASRDEMIECLARNGFTYESIGDAFGVTRQRIEQIINGGRK